MTQKLDDLYNMSEQAAKKLEETKDIVVVDQTNAADDILDTDQAVLCPHWSEGLPGGVRVQRHTVSDLPGASNGGDSRTETGVGTAVEYSRGCDLRARD